MNTLIKEINTIQADIVCVEGMLEALTKGAYTGISVEYIGNSLEILKEYLGQRADRLDQISSPLPTIQGDNITGMPQLDQSSECEAFFADGKKIAQQSEEVKVAYDHLFPYLEILPGKQRKVLCLAIREVETASRKQGFTEGFVAAVQQIYGEDKADG